MAVFRVMESIHRARANQACVEVDASETQSCRTFTNKLMAMAGGQSNYVWTCQASSRSSWLDDDDDAGNTAGLGTANSA